MNTNLKVTYRTKDSTGRQGTMEALVKWNGSWIVKGDPTEMADQHRRVVEILRYPPTGPVTITVV